MKFFAAKVTNNIKKNQFIPRWPSHHMTKTRITNYKPTATAKLSLTSVTNSLILILPSLPPQTKTKICQRKDNI